MLFLYRFDLLQIDPALGDLSTQDLFVSQPGYDSTAVYSYTNFETAVSVDDSLTIPKLAPNYVQPLPDPRVFAPAVISHDGLTLDGQQGAGNIKVTVPRGNPIAQMFAKDYPTSKIMLTVLASDGPSAIPDIVWTGYLSSAEFSSLTAELSAYSIQEMLERSIVSGKFSRGCKLPLYDYLTCGADPMAANATFDYWAFREDGYATAYNPATLALTVAEAANRADGFFANGFIVIEAFYPIEAGNSYPQGFQPRGSSSWSRYGSTKRAYLPTNGIKRDILTHAGGVLTLKTPLTSALPPNAKVSVFAGCDRLQPTCGGKFGNARRFGGYPYIPIKNIYESGIK